MGTAVIDFFATFGQAYDLKKPKVESIKAKLQKNGNSSFGGNRKFTDLLTDWSVGTVFLFSNVFSVLILRFICMGGLYNNL